MFSGKEKNTTAASRYNGPVASDLNTALSMPAVPAVQKQDTTGLEEDPLKAAQMKKAGDLNVVQKEGMEGLKEEDMDKVSQGKFAPVQRMENSTATPNTTGMPDNLKSGVEQLSGFDMSDVNVHYNSDKPAQLNALAYAQGTDIHVGPGQEQHLPHEAWHVAQQKQGRVEATTQMKEGVPVNDDPGLEHEADVMGAKALSMPVAQNQ